MKTILSLVSLILSLRSKCGCATSELTCLYLHSQVELVSKANLVEIDDGSMIADLAVHVTFIKLTFRGSTTARPHRTEGKMNSEELPTGRS